ncbi:MAG: hypothetical protein FWH21_00140 [Kiritimatiellaeota bacterium]|nr:hypothetical protein [Kiritimatiellota bacterium]
MWRELTPDDLLKRVAGAEHEALARAATSAAQGDVLAEIAAAVAGEWRGALARVAALDVRPLALPSEIEVHVLADFRYRAYTRLPGMESLLDALRVEEWRRANHVRDNLGRLVIEPPDEEFLPDPAPDIGVPQVTVPPRVLD